MQLDHIQVKLYAKEFPAAFLDGAIPVFHRWIQESRISDALLIDVVDYAHVPAGPGILLMGHEEYYALEEGAEKRPGLLFSSKISRGDSTESRVREAMERALFAARALEKEPEFAGQLNFSEEEFLLRVNDRKLAPNKPETFEKHRKALSFGIEAALGKENKADLTYKQGDPRSLFCVLVKI